MNAWIGILNNVSAWWIEAVWRACWQGGIVLLAVWLLCRYVPRIPPLWQCWLWRFAFLRLLVAFCWAGTVALPLLKSHETTISIASPPLGRYISTSSAKTHSVPIAYSHEKHAVKSPTIASPITSAPESISSAAPERSLSWFSVLFLVWISAAALVVGRLVLLWLQAKKVLRAAEPVRDESILLSARELAASFGLRDLPLILSSNDAGPLLIGTRKPVIILPADVSLSESRMILSHELSHLHHKDLQWRWLAILAVVFFFFHPLLWLARREANTATEMAADLRALAAADAKPACYGEMLLALSTRTLPLAVGLSEAGLSLSRRLLMLKAGKSSLKTLIFVGGFTFLAVTIVSTPWVLKGRNANAMELGVIPNFSASKTDLWNNDDVAVSANGRYLAVSRSREPGGEGIWLCDLRSGTWKKAWNRRGEIQWKPYLSGMIVASGNHAVSETADNPPIPKVEFQLILLNDTNEKLTELTQVIDWKIIPDGTGMAATRLFARRTSNGTTEDRVETLVFSFETRKWRSVYIAPFKFYDGMGGRHISFRKYKTDWVLGYVEGMTGDNSGWWINLTTGQGMRIHEGSAELEFTPFGKYAVDFNRLYRARPWPILSSPKDWGGNVLAEEIKKMPVAGNARWSPDGHHVAFDEWGNYPGNGVSVFDLKGDKTLHISGETGFACWAGNDNMLLRKEDKFFLHPLAGGTEMEVFRVKGR